ncbi:MAG TPA: hypothetical protein PLB38_03985 [bacterium]|nr:hypothetical protein [bacterium]
MEMQQLTVKKRDISGKTNKAIRLVGYIPAVMYGAKKENINLMLELRELEAVMRKRENVNAPLQLNIEGAGKAENVSVMIKDIQRDPIKDTIIHVDFYRV